MEEFMRLLQGAFAAAIVLVFSSMASGPVHAQDNAAPDASANAPSTDVPSAGSQEATAPAGGTDPALAPRASGPLSIPCRPANQQEKVWDEKIPCPSTSAEAPLPAPAKKIYEVPAGTKVLLQLRSGINTRSAKAGDGVYLASTFPVVVGNRVLIPAGVYVQGVVDRVARAGRVKGRSQLDMHFTEMIFPNGSVVEIPGIVNSLPGARKQSVRENGEGTIEQDADKGRNAGKAAEVAIPTGGTVGSIGGLGSGHPLAGGVAGIGAGVAAAGLVSLFTRGADVNIESGTQVEMLLQRPLLLEDENLSAAPPGSAPALIPSTNQPRPLAKPTRARIFCPPGGLGCE
jgi:type IV secretion system protein VirB10